MLAAAVALLRCPRCGERLALDAGTLRCRARHSFDVARQGYVNLLVGRGGPGGDPAAMLDRRDAVLSAGLFAPLTSALVELAGQSPTEGAVVEVGAGTAHHLAAVLDAMPGRVGVALDTSTAALRRAARAHPRVAAVGADAWSPWPLADACAAVVLAVFAPRDAGQVTRVLAPGGRLLVTSPAPDHLQGLTGPVGLLGVAQGKAGRLATDFEGHLVTAGERHVRWTMSLDRAQAAALALMGPSGFHLDVPDVETAVATLAEPVEVVGSVLVKVLIKAPARLR